MAEYIVQRGPNFGRRVHLPQSQEVNLAVLLGDLQPVSEASTAPKIPQARFAVGEHFGRPVIIFKCGQETSFFDGPVESAAFGFGPHRRVPDEVVALYKTAKETPHPSVVATDGERNTYREPLTFAEMQAGIRYEPPRP